MRLFRRISKETRTARAPAPRVVVDSGRRAYWLRLARRLAIAGGGAAVLLVLLFRGREFLYTSAYFTIRNVVIEGVSPNVTDKIQAYLNGEEGPRNLLDASPRTLRERFLSIPEIKEVTVRRRLPDTLLVTACERFPVAILVGEENYLIDSDLVVIRTIGGPEFLSSSLPLITVDSAPTLKPGEPIRDERLSRTWVLVTALRRKSPDLAATLAETHVDASGDVTLLFEGGAEIRLGQRKPSQALPILEALSKELSGLAQLEYAELQYRNQAAFKKRGAPTPQPPAASKPQPRNP